MPTHLTAAADAIGRSDFSVALAELLAAWRQAPDDHLVSLITEVGKAALPEKDPILTTERDSQQRAWLEIAEKKDPVTLPWLLAAIDGDRATPKQLTMLTALPPDPRCGVFALEWVPKIVMRQGDKLQRAMITLLAHSRHSGARKLLEDLMNSGPGFEGLAREGLGQLNPASEYRHAAPELMRVADAVAAIAKQARAANRTIDELFAAVYADPDSDDARHVLADALLEKEDPRGELIALQLRPDKASSKKAATLLKRLAHEIAKQVAPLMDVVIERGFPVAAIAADERAIARPEFRTLRRLTVLQEGCAFLASPELGNVREIAGTVECLLPALEAGITLPWEKIDLGALTTANHRAFVAALERMPKLKALKSPTVCQEAAAALGAKVRSVALELGFDRSAALVEALTGGLTHGWTMTFTCRPASVRGTLKGGALELKVKSSSLPEEQSALLALLKGKPVSVTLEEHVAADDHRWDAFNPTRATA